MAAEVGPLPTVDEVLNKLKSNGTFDHFRKACLESIEAEPSFRAYGEHIEVVSRRYLQNYKWRDSTTKNQVRTRLKDHALSVIDSPDIQVGVPFTSLVEKAMESKGKELLPKIQTVVKSLSQQAKPAPTSSNSADAKTKPKGREEAPSSKSEMEFDLSLPIDLPGLLPSHSKSSPAVTTAKKPTGAIPANSDSKGSRAKHKGGESSSAKDAKVSKPPSKPPQKADVLVRSKEEGKEEDKAPLSSNTPAKDKKSVHKVKKSKEEKLAKPQGNSHQVKEAKVEKVEAGEESVASSTSSKDTAKSEESTSKKSETESKPAQRRSARIASLTEDPRKNEDSESESDEKTPKWRQSVGEKDVQKKKPSNKSSKGTARKRTRVWLTSSSEESDDGRSAQPKRSKMGKAKGNKDKRQKQEMSGNTSLAKVSRRHSKTGSSSPHAHTAMAATEGAPGKNRRSKSPLKSPPTVTRFNRQVKPNKRYYASSEEPSEEEEEEEDMEDTEKADSEMEYRTNDSSEDDR